MRKFRKKEIKPPSEAPPPSPIFPARTQENPRAARMNLLKETYTNLVKNAF